jgi:Uma2 family endonuclease
MAEENKRRTSGMATVGRRTGPRTRRWTKAEYYRLGELGFFDGQRVELLEGRIFVLDSQSPAHVFSLQRAASLLRGVIGPAFLVRRRGPLDLGQTSEPEPDVCVVTGQGEDYAQAHPTRAVLIVEVSDTRVSYDRRRKGRLYARAGVGDYWIVNLVRRRLEVYRAPVPDPTQRDGHRYSSRTDLTPPGTITPLALPQTAIAVADLLG